MDSQNCSIKDFKESMFPTAYLLIFILGIVGHLVSMYIFFSMWRKRRGLTTVNLFMVNLLVSDLILVCSLPFRAFYFLSGLQWHLVASSPLLILGQNASEFQKCMELPGTNETIQLLITINNTSLTVGFVIPLLIILWCSVLVAYRLWNPGPSQCTRPISKKKACALVIISLSLFLICFLPYHVIRIIFLYRELDMSNGNGSCELIWPVRKAAVVTLCLCVAHSCLDPILFFFVGENFRTFFKNLFRRRKSYAEGKTRCQQRAELQIVQETS